MLSVENLSCGYGREFVLRELDFQVAAGELIGIIGPNGSGKTTFLRSVSRILKPGQGSISIEGKDIWQMRFRDLARKMAVVPQDFSGMNMSVEEFVLLGRTPYFRRFQMLENKADVEIALRSMELTDTLALKGHQMSQISGGERQLVLIARALCQEPRLLLLDEPTSHLDITHQAGVLDLVRQLNREHGLTVIMVLHDLNLASEYCDRLILLNEGRIHKMGVPAEVLTYRIIEEVYKTVVVVGKNPVSSNPYIFIVSEEEKQKIGEQPV